MRLQQRSIKAETILVSIESLEIIEAYADDKYLPSFLLRGEFDGQIFHTQVATDVEGANIRIVTIYSPNAGEWDIELRVRRRQL